MIFRVTAAITVMGLLMGAPARAADPTQPTTSNERVTVWDVTWTKGQPSPVPPQTEDRATVYLTGGPLKVTRADGTSVTVNPKANEATFTAKGGTGRIDAIAGPVRAIVIDLHDHPQAPLGNTTGYPDAFPRPGSKKVLENGRVMIWDYTFAPSQPSPMHFHGRDVVTIYTEDGAVTSTTPTGDKVVNEHYPGEAKFNPRNRTHTEVLSRGKVHIVTVELK